MFLLHVSGFLRDLHSFPTRRSSDLQYSGSALAGYPGKLEFQRGVKCHVICGHLPASTPVQRSNCIHAAGRRDRKSTRLNSSHLGISYAVFCLKKKKKNKTYLIYTNI